jgi:HAD superfamily hydrolase (TIGR01509 family)
VISIKAIILDIDGTLLLSNDAHAKAFAEAAATLRVQANFETIRRLIGKGSDKLIPEAFGLEPESDPGKKITELKGAIFKTRYLAILEPAPGARALLEKFRQQGIDRIAATSAGDDEVTQLLDRAGVRDLVPKFTTSDDVQASKPNPDVVEAALKKIGHDRNVVAMLGDTPYDVEAAQRAGVPIIAVRSGGWTERDLKGALAIYEDPADVLAHYDRIFAART